MVVVTPSTVMETSLTTVLADPLPPELELPPADCEDDVADVAEVDEVEEVADVDDVAGDDVTAVDWDAEVAAAEEAIALMDMKTSLEEKPWGGASGAPCQLLQRGKPARQALAARRFRLPRMSAPDAGPLEQASRCSFLSPVPGDRPAEPRLHHQ